MQSEFQASSQSVPVNVVLSTGRSLADLAGQYAASDLNPLLHIREHLVPS